MQDVSLSIIIPTLRREEMRRCLASIEKYTADIRYEVLIIAPFDWPDQSDVVLVREEKPEGVYRAVSRGFEVAAGEYVIHMPDDARATPGWAQNMISFVEAHPGLVEGNFRHFDVRGERPEPGVYGRLYAPFLCMKRADIRRVGGLMDPHFRSFWGDPDLSLRVWHAGGEVRTCPDAWIYHADHDDTIHKRSLSQYFTADREAFMARWEPIYGVPGVPFRGSVPIAHQLPRTPPPERCTKLFQALMREDWTAMERLVTDAAGEVCVEALPVLYRTLCDRAASRSGGEVLQQALSWTRAAIHRWAMESGEISSPH
jgi:GT2 family glycosyltransferase